jgi:nucleoside-diphosphate-sugar epimerase
MILVTGAGGFIGGFLVYELLLRGEYVRAIDIKPLENWDQRFEEAYNFVADLRKPGQCDELLGGASQVYNFAADMGGIGYIETHKANCMMSVVINAHLLDAARNQNVGRYFYASSACVYAAGKQTDPAGSGLRESDAYPADPEDGYGWEKLFSERMCRHFSEDFGLTTRVARYHNVYGPHGAWDGGREKAPAAICRKVARAVISGAKEIEIWGDGERTRSFLYIDDCIRGTVQLMESECADPLNIGSEEKVSINQLVDIVEEIAGVKLERRYKLDAPQGVHGRNSDNRLVRQRVGWDATTSLRDGMEKTYRWIYDQVKGGFNGG